MGLIKDLLDLGFQALAEFKDNIPTLLAVIAVSAIVASRWQRSVDDGEIGGAKAENNALKEQLNLARHDQKVVTKRSSLLLAGSVHRPRQAVSRYGPSAPISAASCSSCRPTSKSPSAATLSRRRPASPCDIPRRFFTCRTLLPSWNKAAACSKIEGFRSRASHRMIFATSATPICSVSADTSTRGG